MLPINRLIVLLLALVNCGCFPLKAGPRLAHFDQQAPTVGELAPDFTLKNLQGQAVTLQSVIGNRPVVLQLGSHSCPVYRYRRFGMAELYEKYRDQVRFLLVYTLEAHPIGSRSPYSDEEWVSWWNRLPGVLIPQHQHYQERLKMAAKSKTNLDIQYPYLIDEMNNAVWLVYGSASSPAFIIDRQGRIVLRQVWINPTELEETLAQLLAVQPAAVNVNP